LPINNPEFKTNTRNPDTLGTSHNMCYDKLNKDYDPTGLAPVVKKAFRVNVCLHRHKVGGRQKEKNLHPNVHFSDFGQNIGLFLVIHLLDHLVVEVIDAFLEGTGGNPIEETLFSLFDIFSIDVEGICLPV
jgi:hypothetical protein